MLSMYHKKYLPKSKEVFPGVIHSAHGFGNKKRSMLGEGFSPLFYSLEDVYYLYEYLVHLPDVSNYA